MLFSGNEADRKKTAANLNFQVKDSIDPTEFVFLSYSFHFWLRPLILPMAAFSWCAQRTLLKPTA